MKHEKYPGHTGKMVITMPVEDWIWWCKFLSGLLKSFEKEIARTDPHNEEFLSLPAPIEYEDLQVIERSLQDAEEADHVATSNN